MATKINGSLKSVIAPESIITNLPAMMGSEDFTQLVLPNSKTVCDYLFMGTANIEACSKAIKEGKKYPFYNHNGNYQVDLSSIPFGTVIGTTALLEIFKK